MIQTLIEDVNLIQNILTGDNEAEKILYDRYRKIITSYLKSKFPKNCELEDDVSEILIKIFLSLPTYDLEKSKFKTWAFTIAKNHMIDKSRTTCFIYSAGTINIDNNINLLDTTNLNSDTFYSTNTATLDSVGNFENENTLCYVCSQMTTSDFTLMNMHYNYGYSYNEIGCEFNMSSSTVSNRVNYVKSKMKNKVDDDIILK